MAWTAQQLAAIGSGDDLHVAPFRDDGVTYGTLTWIWSVVVDNALYVRGYNGQRSRWYQAAIKQKAGKIKVASGTFDVTFEPVNGAINDAVDEAYRVKYGKSSYLGSMISDRARAATVRIDPIDG